MNRLAVAKPPRASGKAPVVAVASKPGFVITEFLGAADSRIWRARLIKLGFVDRTPIFGTKGNVFSFDVAEVAPQWVEYRNKFLQDNVALDAEWQFISGHHGALHQPTGETTGTQIADRLNNHDEAGCFNEPYHVGTWKRNKPKKNEVFMFTGKAQGATPSDRDNPFAAPRAKTKGVICIACNTLTYRRTRMFLRETFPNAIIFGMMNTTPGGTAAIAPFELLDDAFWSDPRAQLIKNNRPDVDAIKDIVVKMNDRYFKETKTVNAKADIGVMVKDQLFWMDYNMNSEEILTRKFRQERYTFKWDFQT